MKSITELRGLAQALGVKFTFADTAQKLQQLIDVQAAELIAPVTPPPSYVPEDARLRTKPPAKESNREMLEQMLSEHIERGLHVTYPGPDLWNMKFGVKEDSGTLRCPPRVIVNAADKLMKL